MDIYFAIDVNEDTKLCKIWTCNAEFAGKAEWNIFGIPCAKLPKVMNDLTSKVNELGYGCFFYMF